MLLAILAGAVSFVAAKLCSGNGAADDTRRAGIGRLRKLGGAWGTECPGGGVFFQQRPSGSDDAHWEWDLAGDVATGERIGIGGREGDGIVAARGKPGRRGVGAADRCGQYPGGSSDDTDGNGAGCGTCGQRPGRSADRAGWADHGVRGEPGGWSGAEQRVAAAAAVEWSAGAAGESAIADPVHERGAVERAGAVRGAGEHPVSVDGTAWEYIVGAAVAQAEPGIFTVNQQGAREHCEERSGDVGAVWDAGKHRRDGGDLLHGFGSGESGGEGRVAGADHAAVIEHGEPGDGDDRGAGGASCIRGTNAGGCGAVPVERCGAGWDHDRGRGSSGIAGRGANEPSGNDGGEVNDAEDEAFRVGVHASPGRRTPSRAGNHYRSEERRVGKECRSRWSPY